MEFEVIYYYYSDIIKIKVNNITFTQFGSDLNKRKERNKRKALGFQFNKTKRKYCMPKIKPNNTTLSIFEIFERRLKSFMNSNFEYSTG